MPYQIVFKSSSALASHRRPESLAKPRPASRAVEISPSRRAVNGMRKSPGACRAQAAPRRLNLVTRRVDFLSHGRRQIESPIARVREFVAGPNEGSMEGLAHGRHARFWFSRLSRKGSSAMPSIRPARARLICLAVAIGGAIREIR